MVLDGKLLYLKMVKGENDDTYLKLKQRFDKLLERQKLFNLSAEDKLLIPVSDKKSLSTSKFTKVTSTFYDEPGNDNFKENPIFPIYHNPIEFVLLLKKFSINDSALKYTTHSWDAGRDAGIFSNFQDFLDKARQEYSGFSFKMNSLSKNLNAKIYGFLLNPDINKNGWGINRIKFGWSSPEILNECNLNQDIVPEDIILPEVYQSQISGKTIQKFKHVIDVFKNEIEIRDENATLLKLILKRHDKYLISFDNPIVSNLENKSFYTDVQWFSKALDLIFEGIQKWPQHPSVKYSVTESNGDRIVLEILHVGSFKKGFSIYDEKLNLKKGDFSTIKDLFKNLCDWSIESQFSEGFYRINYLTSSIDILPYEKLQSTEGFKHILTFYK